jgi:hypothetical protein
MFVLCLLYKENNNGTSVTWRKREGIVSIRSPSLFYPPTAGVEVVYFHLITDTHHSR